MDNVKSLRSLIRESGLKQWEVADSLDVSEYTLLRWLRREDKISDDIRAKIIDICRAKHAIKKS